MNVILSLMLVLMPFAGQTKQNLSVSIEDLRKAPREVVLDDRSLHLSAYAWRDFAPGNQGLNGTSMMVALKITSADKKPLPSGVRMDHAWVLFGEQAWEVSDLKERKAGQVHDKDSSINCSDRPACEVTIRGGPKWGPDVYVDVVVRLTDSKGQHHVLQAPKQYVSSTH